MNVPCSKISFCGSVQSMSGWGGLEELYARYSASVFRRSRVLLGDDDSARDATQEVFMRVMRVGGQIPSDPTPIAWLYRVTTNLCLNRLRDQTRRSALLASALPAQCTAPPDAEARAAVREILGQVPESMQDIAVYYFLDQLTYDEIARLLGISKRTVSNRLAAFRDLIERLFPGRRLAS
jgi:RNA polymerase sigma-70 factor (ECF subfamily)